MSFLDIFPLETQQPITHTTHKKKKHIFFSLTHKRSKRPPHYIQHIHLHHILDLSICNQTVLLFTFGHIWSHLVHYFLKYISAPCCSCTEVRRQSSRYAIKDRMWYVFEGVCTCAVNENKDGSVCRCKTRGRVVEVYSTGKWK